MTNAKDQAPQPASEPHEPIAWRDIHVGGDEAREGLAQPAASLSEAALSVVNSAIRVHRDEAITQVSSDSIERLRAALARTDSSEEEA